MRYKKALATRGPGRRFRSPARFTLSLMVALLVSAVGLYQLPGARADAAGPAGCGPTFPAGARVIAMSSAPTTGGYWELDQFGDVAAFADAACHGSLTGIHANDPVVGIAATPNGTGYWLVTSDGGVFAFGDAAFYGSIGSVDLTRPIVGMAATPDGGGYWLVASDGGVFAFGDAAFYGSTGSVDLARPIVGMAATPDGGGYWLVAADGGIFAFGDATFHGRATVPPSSSECTSAQLSVRLGRPSGAAGHRGQTVGFVNTSGTSCHLSGYPRMLMLDSSGRPIPTQVIRSSGTTAAEITVSPGGEASFLAYWADSIGYGTEQCPTSSRVEITPPNAHEPITVSWSITPYGGTIQNLRCGSIVVSPVHAR